MRKPGFKVARQSGNVGLAGMAQRAALPTAELPVGLKNRGRSTYNGV